ncbi:hypothetical protein Salat_2890500 [Sesamum alatum]|uniref:Uncharacterized protein n=1 Tax=Sesamum alatum TaxID=300844 RepID=A0AAE1XIL1_9LAMI|nr:hypothetical protein Salat_2890500 [Sesamum alatum]
MSSQSSSESTSSSSYSGSTATSPYLGMGPRRPFAIIPAGSRPVVATCVIPPLDRSVGLAVATVVAALPEGIPIILMLGEFAENTVLMVAEFEVLPGEFAAEVAGDVEIATEIAGDTVAVDLTTGVTVEAVGPSKKRRRKHKKHRSKGSSKSSKRSQSRSERQAAKDAAEEVENTKHLKEMLVWWGQAREELKEPSSRTAEMVGEKLDPGWAISAQSSVLRSLVGQDS